MAIDITMLELFHNGLEIVLVMTDMFSKYTVPTHDQQASTMAQVFLGECFFSLGFQVAFIQTNVRALRVC